MIKMASDHQPADRGRLLPQLQHRWSRACRVWSGGPFLDFAQISPAQLKMEAERGAVAAGRQLDADVDMIKSINKARKAFNELVMAAAKDTTGHDGKTPEEWRQKLAGKGFSKLPPSAKPTYGEMVELEYNPIFGPVGFTARSVLKVNTFVDN